MNRPVKYMVVVPNERYVFAKYIGVFILVLNAIGLVLNSVGTGERRGIAGVIMIAIAIAAVFTRSLRKIYPNPVAAGYFWAVLAWIVCGEYLVAAAVALLWWLNSLIRRHFEFVFTAENILVKSIPARTIKWFELNNAIIKDGLLTIDFKNNKVIQAEILQEESDVDSEEQFNAFCKAQFGAHAFAPGESH